MRPIDPAHLTVSCPKCYAPAGERCTRYGGAHPGRSHRTHAWRVERLELLERAGSPSA